MKKILGKTLKAIGIGGFIGWFIFQAYFYSQLWGFLGLLGGAIGAIPLTIYTFFLWINAHHYAEVFRSLAYLLVTLSTYFTGLYMIRSNKLKTYEKNQNIPH